MGSLYEMIKLQQAEMEKEKMILFQQKLEREMYKDCKCNNCIWGYKEAHYCPLGRCINETNRR